MIPRHNTGNPARRDNEVFASEASKALYILQDFLKLVLDTHTHFVRMSFASLRVMMILLFFCFVVLTHFTLRPGEGVPA